LVVVAVVVADAAVESGVLGLSVVGAVAEMPVVEGGRVEGMGLYW
jgi:hypothetical protein